MRKLTDKQLQNSIVVIRTAFILASICVVAMACSSSGKKSSKRSQSQSRQQIQQKAGESKYNKLSLAIRSGQDREVETAATALLSKEPNDVIVLNALAMHHFRKGRIGLTKILLKQAVDSQAISAGLQNNLGLIYLEEGNTVAAMAAFKEAVMLDEQNFEAAANLGALYASYGDCEKALPHLELAYSNNYRPIDVLNHLAVCWGADRRPEAEGLFRQAMAQDPKNSRILYNAAVYWLRNRNSPQTSLTLIRRLRSTSLPHELVGKVVELEQDVNRHLQKVGG